MDSQHQHLSSSHGRQAMGDFQVLAESRQPEPLDFASVERLCQMIFKERDECLIRLKKDARKRKQTSKTNRQQLAKQEPQVTTISSGGKVELTTTTTTNKRKTRVHRSRLPTFDEHYVIQMDLLFRQVLAPPTADCLLSLFTTQWHSIQRGLLHVLFARAHRSQDIGQYELIHSAVNLMNLNEVPREWLLEIEDLWHHASYHTLSFGKRPDQLTPVHRYRIRRRLRCPTNDLVGDRRYRIDRKTIRLMSELYQVDPRPKREQKLRLAQKTGTPYETVTNWFKNKRQREKKQASRAPAMMAAAADRTRCYKMEVEVPSYESQSSYSLTQTTTTSSTTTTKTTSTVSPYSSQDEMSKLLDDFVGHDYNLYEDLYYNERLLFDPIKEEERELVGHEEPHKCLTPLEIIGSRRHDNTITSQAYSMSQLGCDQPCCMGYDADHQGNYFFA